jgi:hypothetical protein
LPRPRRDGPPRSVADLELPVAALLALAVGLLLAIWLNGLGRSASDGDVLTRSADRTQPAGVQAKLAEGAAQRRAAAAHARVRRVRAARAQRHAAAVAASRRTFAGRGGFQAGSSGQYGADSRYGTSGYGTGDFQQTNPNGSTPTRSTPAPKPKAQPKPKPSGGGGGGGGFDDSG